MKYMGSKNRISKEILPLMLKGRKCDQYWVEPFVGGGNIIDKVTGNRIGSDCNKYIIALLKTLSCKESFECDYIDKDLYLKIKNNIECYEEDLVGFCGTQLSFSAQWFGSYRRDNTGKRDYFKEAISSVNRQASSLQGVEFFVSDYKDLLIPENSIVYCDPPYDTPNIRKSHYIGVDDFCHEDFWKWAENLSKNGHEVFVSEYKAPDNWECIWEKEIVSSVNSKPRKGTNRETEKLFKL